MKLLEPIKVGNKMLRNRIVMPPMETRLNTVYGDVTNEMIDYYRARAKGGVGMLVVENTFIDDTESRSSLVSSGLYSDHLIRGKNLLAEVIKGEGAVAILQLSHGGRQCPEGANYLTPVAPSAVMCEVTGRMPIELTTEKIQEIQESFAQAARRAKQSGFDGVEIHAAHGYLISSFLTPLTNHRQDKYNGSIHNRGRFALETLAQVRALVGEDFIVGIRMNGSDFYPAEKGLTEKEAPRFAEIFEPLVDYISVTGSTYETAALWNGAAMYVPEGPMVYLADIIKKAVKVPVIAVGSLDEISAEQTLEEGKADLVALGRGLIADPELPNKLKNNCPEDIRPCCRGNEGCYSRFYTGQAMRCELNPACGRESTYKLNAVMTKRVVVIGGGIAGMEAARIAALSGHHVALYEKTEHLGGHLIEGSSPNFKKQTRKYVHWLSRQLDKTDVVVIRNVELTPAGVAGMDADVVILAVGSDYNAPPIEGIENAFGVKEVLLNGLLGDSIAVIGGGLTGCETALMLAEQGKTVTVFEKEDDIITDIERNARVGLKTRMYSAGVNIRLNSKVIKINPDNVECEKGEKTDCDAVVNATGLTARSDQVRKMAATANKPVFVIGDCKEARKIYDAVHDAWQAVLDINN
jgi:2,4-dienoyl-CoA reductase-like NADH-dependent reductase (Old Yellow Enzyme family)/thioredoxin reductase